MTKGRKKLIIVIAFFSVITILSVSVCLLSLKTDVFKPDSEVFLKYIGDISDQVINIKEEINSCEIEKIKSNNSNIETKEVKIKHLKQKNTTNENYDSEINKYNAKQEIKENKEKDCNDTTTTIFKEGKQIIKVEERIEQGKYLVKFSDLYKQYFTDEKSDFKEMLKNIGYSEKEISNLKDNDSKIKIDSEAQKKIQEKLVSILRKYIKNKEINKTENEILKIKEKEYKTEKYEIIFTTQEMNDLIVEFLNNIKNEEAKEYNGIIERKIRKIQENNSQERENKIEINGTKGKTKKIVIQTTNMKISLIKSIEDEYLYLTIEENGENSKEIELIGKDGNFKIKIIDEKNRTEKEYSSKEEISDSKVVSKIKYLYKYENNEIEVIQERNVEKKDKLEYKNINSKDIINFSKNSEETNKKLKEKLKNRIDTKILNMEKETNKRELIDTFYAIGILNEQDIMNMEEISDIEVERFNYKFELIAGEKIEKQKVIELVGMIKEKISEIQQENGESIKLKIDEKTVDKDKTIEIMTDFDEKMKEIEGEQYNISLVYDENTKKVSEVLIENKDDKEEENV